MKRKQIEKEAKKEEILSTARKIFSEKGFDNTSMEEIAKKVKIAKGTIYLYFESKYALFLAIVEYAREKMMKKALSLQKMDLTNLEKIREIIKIYVEFTKKYPEYLVIFHSIHHQMKKEDREKIMALLNHKKFDDGLHNIAVILREGIQCGEFRADLNVPEESFRIFSLLISVGVVTNMIKNDTNHERVEGEKVDRYKVLWDTVNKILSFYMR